MGVTLCNRDVTVCNTEIRECNGAVTGVISEVEEIGEMKNKEKVSGVGEGKIER